MSRTTKKVVKGEVHATECHICKKSGEAVHIYSNHNFRNTKGAVVCEIFLKKLSENKCYKCNDFGHFANKCTGLARPKRDICIMIQKRLMKKVESEQTYKRTTLSEGSKTISAKDMDWGIESDDE